MNKLTEITKHNINSFLAYGVEGFESLAELALDLHFSWNHSADEIWKQIDPELWKLTHNPGEYCKLYQRIKLKAY